MSPIISLLVAAAISVPSPKAKLAPPEPTLTRPAMPAVPPADNSKVVIAVAIDTAGNVTYARVQRSSGNPQFDNAMLEAAKQSRYKPQGKPATVTVEYEYNDEG